MESIMTILMEILVMAMIGVASWEPNEFYGPYSCPQSYWDKVFLAGSGDQVDVWDPTCHRKFSWWSWCIHVLPNVEHEICFDTCNSTCKKQLCWCQYCILWPEIMMVSIITILMEILMMAMIGIALWEFNEFDGPYSWPQSYWGNYS